MTISYGLAGLSLIGLAFLSRDTAYPMIAVLFLVCGVGQGLAIVPAPAAILEVVPRGRSGIGSATVSAARQCGTAIGFAVLGAIVNARVSRTGATAAERAEAFVTGLHASLAIAGAAVLTAAIGLVMLRPRADQTAVAPGRSHVTADQLG